MITSVSNKPKHSVFSSFQEVSHTGNVYSTLKYKRNHRIEEPDFKKKVIDNFICTYMCAKTPNPCVECNKYLKFGELFNIAKYILGDDRVLSINELINL